MAASERVTGFGPVAPNVVVAEIILRGVHHGVEAFVAAIERTGDPIIDNNGCAQKAAGACIAGFRPIAPGAVVAEAILWGVHHGVEPFVAAIERTGDPIIDNNGCARKAAGARIAGFRPIAPGTVVAETILRGVHHGVEPFVAAIERTGNTIIDNNGCAREAAGAGVAGFEAVAPGSIVASGVVGVVLTSP